MNSLSAPGLLRVWECAQGLHPIRRALALLRDAWPQFDGEQWARLPIGERDAWLLSLHESLFGPQLDTLTNCPECDAVLETRFSTADIRPEAGAPAESPMHAWENAGYRLGYRLPTSEDLLAVIDESNEALTDDAPSRLLARCVSEVSHEGEPASPGELPAAVVAGLQQAMAQRDPGADTRVSLVCPACDHAFDSRFDIVAYLWSELDDWAQRTLAEVHVLAGAYGWRERDILELSAMRRQHYIELVRA